MGVEAGLVRPGLGPAGQVDLWQVDLRQPCDPADLAADEQGRAARIGRADVQRRFVVGRVAARQVLAGYLGCAPGALRFDPTCRHCGGPHGKPRLVGRQGGRLDWNLANSADLAVIAVAREGQVGVDLEHVRAVPDAERLAQRFFAPEEAVELGALETPHRSSAFLRHWTAKEAFLKARGDGIALGMDWFAIQVSDGAPHRLSLPGEPLSESGRWWIHDISLEPGVLAALAHRSPTTEGAAHV